MPNKKKRLDPVAEAIVACKVLGIRRGTKAWLGAIANNKKARKLEKSRAERHPHR